MPRRRRKKATKSKNNGERNSNKQPLDSDTSCYQDKPPSFNHDKASRNANDFKQFDSRESRVDWQPKVSSEALHSKHSKPTADEPVSQVTCSCRLQQLEPRAGQTGCNIAPLINKTSELANTHVYGTEIGSQSVVSSLHDHSGSFEVGCNNNSSCLVGKLDVVDCDSSLSSSEISIPNVSACYDSDCCNDNVNYEHTVASHGHLFLGSQKHCRQAITSDKTRASSNLELSNKSDISYCAAGSSTSGRDEAPSFRSKSNNWIESYRQHSSSIDFRRRLEKHLVDHALRQAKLYGRYSATSSGFLRSRSDSGSSFVDDLDDNEAGGGEDFSDTESALASLAGSSQEDDSRRGSQFDVSNPSKLRNNSVVSETSRICTSCSRLLGATPTPPLNDLVAQQTQTLQDSNYLLASLEASSSLLTSGYGGCLSSDWISSSSDCINRLESANSRDYILRRSSATNCPGSPRLPPERGGSEDINNNNSYSRQACDSRASSEEGEFAHFSALPTNSQAVESINFHSSDSFSTESVPGCVLPSAAVSLLYNCSQSGASNFSLEHSQLKLDPSASGCSFEANNNYDDDNDSRGLAYIDHLRVGARAEAGERAQAALFSSAWPPNARRHSIACDRYALDRKHLFALNNDDDDDVDVLCPHDNSDNKNGACDSNSNCGCNSYRYCYSDDGYGEPASPHSAAIQFRTRMKAAKDIARIALPSLSSLQHLPGQLDTKRTARGHCARKDQTNQQANTAANITPATMACKQRPASESCRLSSQLVTPTQTATNYGSNSGGGGIARSNSVAGGVTKQGAVTMISCAPATDNQPAGRHEVFNLISRICSCNCATKSSNHGNMNEHDSDDDKQKDASIAAQIERQLARQNSEQPTTRPSSTSSRKGATGRNKADQQQAKRKLPGSVGNLFGLFRKSSSARRSDGLSSSPISHIKRPKSANDYAEMPSQVLVKQQDADPAKQARDDQSSEANESIASNRNSRPTVECNYPFRHRSLSGSTFAYAARLSKRQDDADSPFPGRRLSAVAGPSGIASLNVRPHSAASSLPSAQQRKAHTKAAAPPSTAAAAPPKPEEAALGELRVTQQQNELPAGASKSFEDDVSSGAEESREESATISIYSYDSRDSDKMEPIPPYDDKYRPKQEQQQQHHHNNNKAKSFLSRSLTRLTRKRPSNKAACNADNPVAVLAPRPEASGASSRHEQQHLQAPSSCNSSSASPTNMLSYHCRAHSNQSLYDEASLSSELHDSSLNSSGGTSYAAAVYCHDDQSSHVDYTKTIPNANIRNKQQPPLQTPSPAIKLKLVETPGIVLNTVEFVSYGSDSQEESKSSEMIYNNDLSYSASLLCYDTSNPSTTRSFSSLSNSPRATPKMASIGRSSPRLTEPHVEEKEKPITQQESQVKEMDVSRPGTCEEPTIKQDPHVKELEVSKPIISEKATTKQDHVVEELDVSDPEISENATEPKTVASAPSSPNDEKGFSNSLPAKIRAAFKSMGTAIWKSMPINVFLLILVAGMFVVPMIHKDACCELSNTRIPQSQLSFTRKPI